ncbi:MAG: flagellar hook-basal body protein [Bacillota bacterium]|nr:flagellar hook-basal body protein [Bacillota bacterium]
MLKGLYISASNLTANQKKLEVISNNLANLETTGFKKEVIDFESFNARIQTRINGTNLPYESGTGGAVLRREGEEYIAQAKNGYFTVETEDGIHYGKEMRFRIADGYLLTPYRLHNGDIDPRRGNHVLSKGERIRLQDPDTELSISDDGVLTAGGQSFELLSPVHPTAIGTMSAGVKTHTLRTDFEQGTIIRTDNKTDFALQGDGFFVVKHEATGKEFLTRYGAMTLDRSQRLVTLDGSVLQGLNGDVVLESPDFAINAFGEIIQNGEAVDRLQLVRFTNKSDLFKVGSVYFEQRPDPVGERVAFEGEVIQGHIERSNVDSIREMVSMIELNRTYESSQKAVTTIDEMLGRSVNELGKL